MKLGHHKLGRRGRRRMRTCLATTIILLVVAVQASRAQLPGHAYIPLEDWSTPYLEYLVRRGIVPDPSPMLRPWRASDIGQALAAARTGAATGAELKMLKRLQRQYPAVSDTVSLWLRGDVGIRTSTHSRINSELREAGPGQTFEQIGAAGVLQAGPVAIAVNHLWDPNFNHDPDYGGRSVPIKIRYPQAYLSLRSRYVALDLGRLRRNWGPVGLPSLIVSSNPYPYDQLFIQAGLDRVGLQMTVAQLDDMVNSEGDLTRRFWVAHRVSAHISDRLNLAIWESSIIAQPGQTLELWFINPITVQFQGEDEQLKDTNAIIGGDGELRLSSNLRLAGSIKIDDIQIVDSGSLSDEPPSYALTGIVDWSYKSVTLSAAYTQVSNLSYRTHDRAEAFLSDQNLSRGRPGVGLARNFSDYDQLTLTSGFLAAPGMLLSPEVTILRQGEGDLRLPFPAVEDFPNTATLFQGQVETTFRAAVNGSYVHPSGIYASFSAGWHHIADLNHIEGQSDDKVVGTLYIRYIFNRAWPLKAAGFR